MHKNVSLYTGIVLLLCHKFFCGYVNLEGSQLRFFHYSYVLVFTEFVKFCHTFPNFVWENRSDKWSTRVFAIVKSKKIFAQQAQKKAFYWQNLWGPSLKFCACAKLKRYIQSILKCPGMLWTSLDKMLPILVKSISLSSNWSICWCHLLVHSS